LSGRESREEGECARELGNHSIGGRCDGGARREVGGYRDGRRERGREDGGKERERRRRSTAEECGRER
jgi:hypothetical protein